MENSVLSLKFMLLYYFLAHLWSQSTNLKWPCWLCYVLSYNVKYDQIIFSEGLYVKRKKWYIPEAGQKMSSDLDQTWQPPSHACAVREITLLPCLPRIRHPFISEKSSKCGIERLHPLSKSGKRVQIHSDFFSSLHKMVSTCYRRRRTRRYFKGTVAWVCFLTIQNYRAFFIVYRIFLRRISFIY